MATVRSTFSIDESELDYLREKAESLNVPVSSVLRSMIRDIKWLDESLPPDQSPANDEARKQLESNFAILRK